MGWSIHKLMHCKKNPIQTYFIAQHSLLICKLQTYAVDNAHTIFLGAKIMNAHKTSSHSFLWNGVGHLSFVRRIFLLKLEERKNTENKTYFNKSNIFLVGNQKSCYTEYTPRWQKIEIQWVGVECLQTSSK